MPDASLSSAVPRGLPALGEPVEPWTPEPEAELVDLGRNAARREILSRRTFDFTTLASSSTLEYVIARAVPVLGWAEAVLGVRLHSLTCPTGATIDVFATPVAPTPDDPSRDFATTTPAARLTIVSTMTTPSLLQATLSPGFGSHVQIALRTNRDSGSATFTAGLSIELVLKTHPSEPTCIRTWTTHVYDTSSNTQQFIPFEGTASGTPLSDANNQLRMIAPHDGWLVAVTLYVTASSGAGSTVIGLHIDDSSTALETVTTTVPQKVATRFEFGPQASFQQGNRLSISIDPTIAPNDCNVVCEWMMRRSG